MIILYIYIVVGLKGHAIEDNVQVLLCTDMQLFICNK